MCYTKLYSVPTEGIGKRPSASVILYRAFSSRDHNRNKLAILVYNLYSMSLAVYAIAIKKKEPQASINVAVSTYLAVVFCPIQHILEVL